MSDVSIARASLPAHLCPAGVLAYDDPMTREEIVAGARAVLAGAGGVRLALLFGSVARNSAREDSDVDLAVAVDPGMDLARLSAELSRVIGREVQIVDLAEAGVPLLDEIIQDGIVVYEARPGIAASWRSRTLGDLEIDRPWYARMRDAWLRRVAERGLGDGQS